MTTRQSDVLKFLKQYIVLHGFVPTYTEIAKGIGINSVATVHKHLHCLKAEGRITIRHAGKQSIEIITEPADEGRFEFEGPHRLWDKKLECYWLKEKK